MRKTLLLLGLFILCFSTNTFSKERRLEYKEFNQVLDLVTNKVNSKYFVSIFKVEIKNSSLTYEDIELWLTLDGKKIAEGKLDSAGNISFPILNQEKAENVMLNINQSEDDAGISLYTDVVPIKEPKVSYRELFSVLKDLNHFISIMAGNMSWFVPSLDEIEFSFSEPATISFVTGVGQDQLFQSDDDNRIEIPLKDEWLEFNPQLVFSQIPKSYTPKL
ncbi:DUF2987 domain-containing protein [Paraglaciecola aestuariivivens]